MTFRLSIVLSATVSLTALATAETARAQDGGTTQLEQIEVEGQGQGTRQGGGGGGAAAQPGPPTTGTPGVATSDGYVAKTTRTATKTDTPVHETPQTINTVTPKQIEDQRPQNLQEALAYTPGVRGGAFGFDPRFDSFFIRGVDVTYTGVFRDGLRQFNSPNGLFRLEPYGLEQISILKGSASAIYGASSSAGIIDLVSKRPTDYTFGEVEAQTGSFDRIQGNFDFGGPLNDEGTVLYRITGLARDADTELGKAVRDDRAFIAPSITFRPTDDTKLTVLAEFMDATTGGSAVYNNNYGLLFDKNGNQLFDETGNPLYGTIGANKNFGPTARYNDFNQKQGRIGYEFEHAFNDRVSIHQNLRFSGVQTNQEYSFFDDFGGYSSGLVRERNRALGVDTFVKTLLDTGPARHTVLAGVDFGHLRYTSRQGVNPYVDPGETPDFGDPDLNDPNLSIRQRQRQTITGVYLQDEIALDRWRLLLGGRHDWLDSSFGPNELRDPDTGEKLGARVKQKEGEFTGRAALSYVAPNGLTPYVSYGTSFNANSGAVIDPDGDAGPQTGGVAKPTKGETAEAGLKYAVPGYNATINGSVFWLKQVDGVIFDASSGLNRQVQADFRSRGAEIDATASLANGVNLIASYSYTETKILKLSDLAEGNEVSGIPNHAFSLWAGYDFKTGAAKGLSVGAGVRYTGKSFGDDLNRPVIANKARAFVDAKLAYDLETIDPKLKGVRLQVNAQNLFDKVEQVCTAGYCYYDKGRQVLASIKYRW